MHLSTLKMDAREWKIKKWKIREKVCSVYGIGWVYLIFCRLQTATHKKPKANRITAVHRKLMRKFDGKQRSTYSFRHFVSLFLCIYAWFWSKLDQCISFQKLQSRILLKIKNAVLLPLLSLSCSLVPILNLTPSEFLSKWFASSHWKLHAELSVWKFTEFQAITCACSSQSKCFLFLFHRWIF